MTLNSPITELHQVSTRYASLLAKLNIFTVRDLLTHFPRYHKDTTAITSIADIESEGDYTIQVRVESFKSVRIRGGRTLQSAVLADETGTITATWFNQGYLKQALAGEHEFMFAGRVKQRGGRLDFYPNNFEPLIAGREQLHLGRLSPQYPLTGGIGIKWLRNRIKSVIDQLPQLNVRDEMQLVMEDIQPLAGSLKTIHFPENDSEIEAARERLSLTELTALQLKVTKAKTARGETKGIPFEFDGKIIKDFTASLNFQLTPDQEQAIATLLADLENSTPMNRLLEGDVGSGKTVVAVIAALASKVAGYQTVVLAPTTVLAHQHFLTFSNLLSNTENPLRTSAETSIELVTSANKQTKSADILIGTSAVLARKSDLITNLGLVIVDEQHRFGVGQREELLEPFNLSGQIYPHFLNMTATPIPRTLALAVFGEVEVTSIKTKPAGRKPIRTHLVAENKRPESYSWIRSQVKEGHQVYWITPLVEESDKMEISSAKTVYEDLATNIFPDLKVALLHGKMKHQEKQDIMQAFSDHKIDLLVSTSVIEVGINVPNASIMVIESAERFGLAQLHQLRGRVGRGEAQSWCFLFLSSEVSEQAISRLEFFTTHHNGLEIAEFDLAQRGPGEVYGTRQTGIPNLKIASLTDLAQIRKSKEIAQQLWEKGIEEIELFS